jgi:hypothetical protein
LRAEVFRKAFAAVSDLRRQTRADGGGVELPGMEVRRDWAETSVVLLPGIRADGVPRSRAGIEQALVAALEGALAGRGDLAGLCAERGNGDEDLRDAAARCAGDAITRRQLAGAADAPGSFTPSTD